MGEPAALPSTDPLLSRRHSRQKAQHTRAHTEGESARALAVAGSVRHQLPFSKQLPSGWTQPSLTAPPRPPAGPTKLAKAISPADSGADGRPPPPRGILPPAQLRRARAGGGILLALHRGAAWLGGNSVRRRLGESEAPGHGRAGSRVLARAGAPLPLRFPVRRPRRAPSRPRTHLAVATGAAAATCPRAQEQLARARRHRSSPSLARPAAAGDSARRVPAGAGRKEGRRGALGPPSPRPHPAGLAPAAPPPFPRGRVSQLPPSLTRGARSAARARSAALCGLPAAAAAGAERSRAAGD